MTGAHVIETILEYSKPPAPGPYVEVHNTANLTVPSANVSLYIMFDGTVVSSVCGGRASMFNFTAHFCASNATSAGSLLHTLHSGDAMTVGQFLGGQNYTNCAALGVSSASASPTASATMTAVTPSPTPAVFRGAGNVLAGSVYGLVFAVISAYLNWL